MFILIGIGSLNQRRLLYSRFALKWSAVLVSIVTCHVKCQQSLESSRVQSLILRSTEWSLRGVGDETS